MRRLNFMIRLSALGASQKDICYNTLDGMHPSLFTPSVSSLANLCRQAINHICDARWPGHCSLSWANLITSCASSHSFSNMSFIFFSCVYLATSISFLYCFVQLGSLVLFAYLKYTGQKKPQTRDLKRYICICMLWEEHAANSLFSQFSHTSGLWRIDDHNDVPPKTDVRSEDTSLS